MPSQFNTLALNNYDHGDVKYLNFCQISRVILCPESALKTVTSTSEKPAAERTIMRVNSYVQEVKKILEEIACCLQGTVATASTTSFNI